MLSSTTLADIRAQLGWMVPDSTEFLQDVNQALSSVINNGLWEGTIRTVLFNGSTTGYITLPWFASSIIGVTVNKWPQMVFDQYRQYVECGPGIIDPTLPGCGPLTFMGDSFVTAKDHIVGQQLRFRISNAADANKVVRISGTNTSGTPIFDATGAEGNNLKLLSPVTTFAVNLNEFTGIQKPATLGTLAVYSWDGVTETLLSLYEPWETKPHYSRYLTGVLDSTFPIACLIRIGYTPLVNDTDWAPIQDMNAWEYALQAINFQHVRDTDNAKKSWASCTDQLNQEVRALRGKAQPVVNLIGPQSNRYRVKTN